MTYKELVANYLQTRLDTGMTQAQLARLLGFKGAGNIISMHLDPQHPVSPFPLNRLPALARECGLDAYECLVLMHRRAVDHGETTTTVDKETLHFMMRCGAGAVRAYRARHVLPGASYGC